MATIQVELPPDLYRKLVAEAARQGKPAPLVAQEWLIERAAATGSLPDVDEHALAVLRDAGLLAELSPDEQARAVACTTTLEEVQEALSRGGGQPLSELIIEQRGPKA
jgi:hypothetical protein